jgi:hypothetical protein
MAIFLKKLFAYEKIELRSNAIMIDGESLVEQTQLFFPPHHQREFRFFLSLLSPLRSGQQA